MAEPMVSMRLSTGPSMKSKLLNFLLVKTLPSPREHNRKMVASQQWCWSLEQPHQASSYSTQLARSGGHGLAVGPASPVFLVMAHLQEFGLFIYFSTGTKAHGEMHWANVQTSTAQYSGMSASLMSVVPFSASALHFTLLFP